MEEIQYHDGKPVRVKVDPSEEIKKELHQDTEIHNDFDDTKRDFYANLPQAQVKRDRSITARSLNAFLESFNRRRYESKFDLGMLKMPNAPYCYIYAERNKEGIPKWAFVWTFADSKIETTKKPENGYDLSWKSSKFSKFDRNLLPTIYKELEAHILRKKD